MAGEPYPRWRYPGVIMLTLAQRLKGQGLVEYAFILMLVAIVVVVVVALLGPTVGNMYSQIVVSI